MEFFWVGDSAGISVCRLYAACDVLQLEVGAEGQLFGLSYQEACVVANPEECWNEKRRLFLTGFRTQVHGGTAALATQSGEVPCLFEKQLELCHRLQRLQMPGVENCDICRFASKEYLSERLPLASSFPSGTHLSATCHPDLYHSFVGSTARASGLELTCVNGNWVEEGGTLSMIKLGCQIGLQVTATQPSSYMDYDRSSRGEEWFEAHYGKTLRSWDGLCLAPDHWAGAGQRIRKSVLSLALESRCSPGEAAEANAARLQTERLEILHGVNVEANQDVPHLVSFVHLAWGRIGHAQLQAGKRRELWDSSTQEPCLAQVGTSVSFWNKKAGRFLMASGSSLRGSEMRSQLEWAGLEDSVSFFVVAAGKEEVALYNLQSPRFLQITSKGLQLSDKMNWEHVSHTNRTAAFKAFGSCSASFNLQGLF